MADDDATTWGWDLTKGQVIRWADRGPADDVLGPYATREAAEDWRSRVEERNEDWETDEEWNDTDDPQQ